MAPLKIVYILGSARSGSTLLTKLLGQLDGFFAAAEVRLVWRGLAHRKCGCGRPVLACPVWTVALEKAGAASGHLDADEMLALQGRTARSRHTPGLLRRDKGQPLPSAAATYLRVLTELYKGLAEASGARVIVDSSKQPAEAALLSHAGDVDVSVVQLVRDPRAVTYSWARFGQIGPAGERRQSMLETSLYWPLTNVMAEYVRRRLGASRSAVIRYEDLMSAPMRTLTAVAALAGEQPAGLSDGDGFKHMVGGNRLRLAEKALDPRKDLHPDHEWLGALSPWRAGMVSAVCLPMLVRYGYPLRPGAVARSTQADDLSRRSR